MVLPKCTLIAARMALSPALRPTCIRCLFRTAAFWADSISSRRSTMLRFFGSDIVEHIAVGVVVGVPNEAPHDDPGAEMITANCDDPRALAALIRRKEQQIVSFNSKRVCLPLSYGRKNKLEASCMRLGTCYSLRKIKAIESLMHATLLALILRKEQ